jgi:hypothetical protein
MSTAPRRQGEKNSFCHSGTQTKHSKFYIYEYRYKTLFYVATVLVKFKQQSEVKIYFVVMLTIEI